MNEEQLLESIPGTRGNIPAFVSVPKTEGPWPGVIVIHDALGMTEDLRDHARWLSNSGYLAAAPDLFHWGSRARCLIKSMKDLAKSDRGRTFDDIASVKAWVLSHYPVSGKMGIMGFCYGGGFALALAPNHGYSASAVNYGAIAEWGWEKLGGACPIVASFGQKDPTLKGQARRLEAVLTQHGIPNDIKEYEGVGHGFMNLHSPEDSGWVFKFLSWISNTRYDESATLDARKRILGFFDTHLKS